MAPFYVQGRNVFRKEAWMLLRLFPGMECMSMEAGSRFDDFQSWNGLHPVIVLLHAALNFDNGLLQHFIVIGNKERWVAFHHVIWLYTKAGVINFITVVTALSCHS